MSFTDTKEEPKFTPKESNIYYIHPQQNDHTSTIIWLHGLGDHGGSWLKIFKEFAKTTPNTKYIFPYVIHLNKVFLINTNILIWLVCAINIDHFIVYLFTILYILYT